MLVAGARLSKQRGDPPCGCTRCATALKTPGAHRQAGSCPVPENTMRLRFLTAAALALPMALAAQTTNNVTASFKASSARYGGWVAAPVGTLPPRQYSDKTTPAQPSRGYVAPHPLAPK